jgi:hypothetical protein
LVENCSGLIKALSVHFALTYGEKSKTFLTGANLFQFEFRKWFTPIRPSQDAMKERDCLKHLVKILETIVRCVIYAFQFLYWSSYNSTYIYTYTHTHTHTHIYIYIYIYTGVGKSRFTVVSTRNTEFILVLLFIY